MVKIYIGGIAGNLGANLAKELVANGYQVAGNDIIRFEEAWRLHSLKDKLKYIWKAGQDLTLQDIKDFDIVIDCMAVSDRPLGISSPTYIFNQNILLPLILSELLKRQPSTWLLYPGSGTIFLGVPAEEQPITEETLPKPTNPYSLSKWMAEEVYRTYSRTYGFPYSILRSGLVYGIGARLDISIMKWILRTLQEKPLIIRSPRATRTPCYAEDILDAWLLLIEKITSDSEPVRNETIHFVADHEFTMIEIAEKVKEILQGKNELIETGYEAGELINGKPVRQHEINVKARKLLGWKAKTSLEEGIKLTARWMEREILNR